jgi:glycerol-3-phosphate dehydrogenase (NAD(P)+)
MRVAVLGAGSWGTVIASMASAGATTTLWAREPEVVEAIEQRHENDTFLPGFALPERLRATDDLEEAVRNAEVVAIAVPSRYFRDVAEQAAPFVPPGAVVVSVTKGLEPRRSKRMSEVLDEVWGVDPGKVCVLSGPNLAREVMAGQPSATVVASRDAARAGVLQRLFMSDSMRVYTNPDVVGCEVGGAVKNVLAIGAGIADGLGFGWNTKAALITRGLAELARFGVAVGGEPLTFLGLAGNGDLTATCSSPQSRNRHVGEELGRGRALDDVTAEMRMVAEGVGTARPLVELARQVGVEMPICENVAAVLEGHLSPSEVVPSLMRRAAQAELRGIAD